MCHKSFFFCSDVAILNHLTVSCDLHGVGERYVSCLLVVFVSCEEPVVELWCFRSERVGQMPGSIGDSSCVYCSNHRTFPSRERPWDVEGQARWSIHWENICISVRRVSLCWAPLNMSAAAAGKLSAFIQDERGRWKDGICLGLTWDCFPGHHPPFHHHHHQRHHHRHHHHS